MKYSPSFFISIILIFFVGSCTQQIDTTGTTESTGPATATSNSSKPAYTPPSNTGDSTGGGSTSTTSKSTADSVTINYTVLTTCVDSNVNVRFNLISTRKVKNATYEWYFNDGNSISSGPDTVLNTYIVAGSYTVIAKLDSAGSTLASTALTIKLTGSAGTPVAAFSAIQSVNTYAFNTSASTISSGTIKNYYWDFGDGNTLSTTQTYVSHTYSQQSTAQIYIVNLTETGSGGCTNTVSSKVKVPSY